MKNRKLIWPAVIGGGVILGLLFALLMPSSWLLAAREDLHDHDNEADVAGGEFYACPMF